MKAKTMRVKAQGAALQATDTLTAITRALAFAVLTGALSQIKIYLPWTPVPITGQTLSVLLAGALIGSRLGALSQAIYVALGAAGVPWFANLSGGIGYLAGPTGGYLIGFIAAAYIVGFIFERTEKMTPLRVFLTFSLANFAVIHLLGVAHLTAWLNLVSGKHITLIQALRMGSLPFIPGDLLKIAIATSIVSLHRR